MSACVSKPQTANKPTDNLVESGSSDSLETDAFIPTDLTEYRDTIVGNFSGHGIDTLISEPTDIKSERMDWKWQVRDTKNKLKPLVILSTFSARMIYEGDLDKNGTDEFGLRRENIDGTWDNYYIFTYENGEWKHLIEPVFTYAIDFYETFDMGRDVAEPTNKKGRIRIRYTEGVTFRRIDTLWTINIRPVKGDAFGVLERHRETLE